MLPSQRDAKAASEYLKSLSSWLELDYFRRPRRLKRIRGLVTWTVLIGSTALIAALTWLPGNRQIYQAASVSTAHALFNEDCQACHDAKFGTAKRLLSGDNAVRSVTDEACLRCHAGDTHHMRQVGKTACVGCHHEHQGLKAMARVSDGHCTSCHANLESHTDTTKPGDADRPFRDVSTFMGGPRPHPPFFLSEHPKDEGTIRFNHQAHMNPKGLPVAGSLDRKTLRCTDCHQTDDAGRYMKPIHYQTHCRDCHPLNVQITGTITELAANEEADRFRNEPAAHPNGPQEGAETVRAIIRDRFIRFAQQFPSVQTERTRAERAHPLPGRPKPASDANGRSGADWAELQLSEASRLLFEGAGGCRYCHRVAAESSPETHQLPRFELPQIKSRWFPHSVFSHERHRSLDCRQCHAQSAESRLTSDVLMPTIQSCQQCHNGKTQGARTDCVECHAYHAPHENRDSPRDLAIEDFLRGQGAPAPAKAHP
ncbi:cytochrome c3 family protein [Singulisphaera acidiphila]|uniref:Doubled CXXCH motif-containing protein n=1 Tax=Singulisphaera acidiphila (strain ATCC BAA-1392 / DSM 18658 / VKM B-2454 / MOB10) TaxID=886293 RepID=L0DIA1_SINAD|nr:cytochrome c3 family protein [Singulisphaera acidiphila]AGA29124.1 doubled CXXCH motif-containing protein [Singulisphaera acidiphila DSM 18658]